MRILLLGGTRDAIDVARQLITLSEASELDIELIYSLAGLVRKPSITCTIHQGGFSQYAEPLANDVDNSKQGLKQYLLQHQINKVIDATHPYATNISSNAAEVCKALNIPLLSYCRPPWQARNKDQWIMVDNWSEAKKAMYVFKRPFITIGRDAINKTDSIPEHQFWLIRSAIADNLSQANYQIIKAIGPFSEEQELTLMKAHNIDVVVCKNSGGNAVDGKLKAARTLQIPVIMLNRPKDTQRFEHTQNFVHKHELIENIMTNSQKPALLVVGHGSRDVDAVEEFHQLAKHFQEKYPDRLCATGFLEFARPVIADGLHKLVEQGAKNITAVPGMLMAAGHAKNDIPSELNTLQAEYDGVNITYGTHLGVHPKMVRAAAERIEEAEATMKSTFRDDYDRKDTLLVVVGRGASDSDANSNICKITRMLEEGMGFGWAITCFSGVTSPLVDDALERAHGLGFKKVIVFPYFLFTGRLVKKIYEWSDEYQAKHPEVTVVNAPYLNDHPLVLETFMEKMEEAEQGTGNMNCQMCQYRVQILGSEHKVGSPQEGHHHHVRGSGTDADLEHSHDHGHHHHDHK